MLRTHQKQVATKKKLKKFIVKTIQILVKTTNIQIKTRDFAKKKFFMSVLILGENLTYTSCVRLIFTHPYLIGYICICCVTINILS